MRIIFDAMGSDKGSAEFVKGAVLAAKETDAYITLVGKEEELALHLKTEDADGKFKERIDIVNATEVVEMTDDPLKVMKSKPDSSMTVAMRLLSEGKGDAVISAGNTGALLTQATLIVKRIRGIRRAALAPVTPTATGSAILIDSGANAECTAEYLYQFALMGSFYAENALGIKSPKVGLLNNGAEEHKGTEMHVAAHKLLSEAGDRGLINFIGNIEGRDGPMGAADVIVADGFSGNIYLKTMEGVGIYFGKMMKNMFLSSLGGKIAGLLVKKHINEFKKKLDHNEAGGAPLLGIRKPVIKAHGSAGAVSLYRCVLQAIDYVESGMAEKISQSLKEGELGDE